LPSPSVCVAWLVRRKRCAVTFPFVEYHQRREQMTDAEWTDFLIYAAIDMRVISVLMSAFGAGKCLSGAVLL